MRLSCFYGSSLFVSIEPSDDPKNHHRPTTTAALTFIADVLLFKIRRSRGRDDDEFSPEHCQSLSSTIVPSDWPFLIFRLKCFHRASFVTGKKNMTHGVRRLCAPGLLFIFYFFSDILPRRECTTRRYRLAEPCGGISARRKIKLPGNAIVRTDGTFVPAVNTRFEIYSNKNRTAYLFGGAYTSLIRYVRTTARASIPYHSVAIPPKRHESCSPPCGVFFHVRVAVSVVHVILSSSVRRRRTGGTDGIKSFFKRSPCASP